VINLDIKKYLKIGLSLSLVYCTTIYIFHDILFNILNFKIEVKPITLLLFGLYVSIRLYTDTYAMVLQATSHLKIMWKTVIIQAPISVVLQWYLAIDYGINGVLIGLVLSFVLSAALILPIYYHKKIFIYND
jgi:Na+-driven multidrug efflux pump